MFKEERHLKIINYMEENKNLGSVVSINELINKFKVSKSTMRRDLDEIEKAGFIKRVHGGAMLLNPVNHQYDFNLKREENQEDKNRIASYAASLIEDGDVVGINSSTLTALMGKYIEANDVKIITNSIGFLNELDGKSKLDVFLLGGTFFPLTKSVEGNLVVADLEKMYFDKVFLGSNGVDLDNGVTTAGPVEVAGKESMIRRSKASFLLSESTKFNKTSFYKIGGLEDFKEIITDGTNEILRLDQYKKITRLVLV